MTKIDDKFKEEMVKPADEAGKFESHGITDDYLIGKLKEELEAEEELQRIISKKETIIIKKPLWKIRQDARKDAHKLKGDYPAEKHEHTGDVIFHSNVPEPDMPTEEGKPPTEPKEYSPKPSSEKMTAMVNEFIEGTADNPVKDHPEQLEPGIGEHEVKTEISGEFKDHHRSRREDGK